MHRPAHRLNPLRSTTIAVATIVVLLAGIFLGGHSGWMPGGVRSVFVSESQPQQRLQTVLSLIQKDYYRPTNAEKLTNTGLQSLVASLNDPYSHYYPPSLYKSFEQLTNPQVTGIGVSIDPEEVDHGLLIEEVFSGSPAARAGLKHGDVIVAVGARQLDGIGVDAASNLIRGKAGTTVALRLKRGKQTLTVRIVRQQVTVPVVSSKLVHADGVTLGDVTYTQFTQGSATQLRSAVEKVIGEGAKGLILDLRDNPGGLLEQAVQAASIFIPSGVIVSTRGRAQPTTTYDATGNAISSAIPMAVLVDRGTASSAEIVTAALQDHRRATVIGTHTYGKGVFQQIFPLSWGGGLDITVGEFFTPNGRNLGGAGVAAGRSVKEGAGVTPNIYVKDNPKKPGSEVLKVAERTLAGKLK
jgi:carboxyl-terminal processing protease